MTQEASVIGASSHRKEGRAKVMGTAIYTDDKFVPDALHGVTVRSQVPRGILKGIRFGEGIPWAEFTIVTAADIPGKNLVAGRGRKAPPACHPLQDSPLLARACPPARSIQVIRRPP